MSTQIIIKSLFFKDSLDFLGFSTNYNEKLYGTISIKEFNELIEFINSNSRRFDNGSFQFKHKNYIREGIQSSIEQINRNYLDRNLKVDLCPSNTELTNIYITITLPINQIISMPLNKIKSSENETEREIILLPPQQPLIENNKIINYSQTQISSFDPKDIINLKAVICSDETYQNSLYNYLSDQEYFEIINEFNNCKRVYYQMFYMVYLGILLSIFIIGIFCIIEGILQKRNFIKKTIERHNESTKSFINSINSKYESRGISFNYHRVKKNDFKSYLIAYIPKDSKELPILTSLDDLEFDKTIICTTKNGEYEPKYKSIVNNIIDSSNL